MPPGTGQPFRSADGALVFELTPPGACHCGRSHVALAGDIDVSGIDRLSVALEWIRLSGHRLLVIDVSEVGFLSATGLGVLVRAARAHTAAGGSLQLARPTSMIERILLATRVYDLLIARPDPRCDTLGSAAESSDGGGFDRISRVLAGMPFPAMRWELLTQADYYGADHRSRTELAALPEGRYADMTAVHQALRRARRLPEPRRPAKGVN